MPLIILGLLVLIGLLIYAIISYVSSGKEINPSSIIRSNSPDNDDDEESKVIYFPTENIDREKHKRNIH